MKNFLRRTNLLYWVGKILIVAVFLYFGTESILNPSTFSYLVPDFFANIIPANTLVMIHGAVEIICALMILFGLAGLTPYIILGLAFLGVLTSVPGTIFIRDIAIFGGLLLLTHVSIKRGL